MPRLFALSMEDGIPHMAQHPHGTFVSLADHEALRQSMASIGEQLEAMTLLLTIKPVPQNEVLAELQRVNRSIRAATEVRKPGDRPPCPHGCGDDVVCAPCNDITLPDLADDAETVDELRSALADLRERHRSLRLVNRELRNRNDNATLRDEAYCRLDSFATGGPDPDIETLRADVFALLEAFDGR